MSPQVKMRQYELYNDETRSTMLCWLDASESLKPEQRVTLKGVDGIWKVTHAYSTVRTFTDIQASKRWQVGGLE